MLVVSVSVVNNVYVMSMSTLLQHVYGCVCIPGICLDVLCYVR